MQYTDCPKSLEDLFKLKYVRYLFQMAEQNEAMRSMDFKDGYGEKTTIKYVLLDPKYDWTGKASSKDGLRVENVDLSRLVDLATEKKMTSFFVEEYFFIISKNVPEEFIGSVLCHESTELKLCGVGERCTMDKIPYMQEEGCSKEEIESFVKEEMEYARKFPHIQGCCAELTNVFSKGEEFAKRYADWLIELNGDTEDPTTFFNQLLPGFLARNGRQNKSPLHSVIEFYMVIDHRFYNIDRLIQDWPWIKACIPEQPLKERI